MVVVWLGCSGCIYERIFGPLGENEMSVPVDMAVPEDLAGADLSGIDLTDPPDLLPLACMMASECTAPGMPICSPQHICVACATDQQCIDLNPAKPNCDTSMGNKRSGQCLACVDNGDCCFDAGPVCGVVGGGGDPTLSCSLAECGGSGGVCYCDIDCVFIGDCCADACLNCGAC